MTAGSPIALAVMHDFCASIGLSGLLLSQRRIFVIFTRERFVFFAFLFL
jgi:putative Ca2+/H+ antiporter (TMEM165/GDT1 family)